MNTENITGNETFCQVNELYQLYGTESFFATVLFYIPMTKSYKEVMIPFKDIKSLSMKKYVPENFFMGNASMKRMQEYIFCDISEKANCSEPKLLLPQGFNKIGEKWVYVLGDKIINDDSEEYKPYNPLNLTIETKAENISVDTSCKWFKYFCKQGEAQVSLCLSSLFPYIYPVLQNLGFSATYIPAFLVGPSGSGKTSYAKLVTQLYAGDNEGINLGSDKKEIISELSKNYTDRCFLLDDLNISASNAQVDKRLARVSEIVQIFSSAGLVCLNGDPVDVSRTGIIITGEFLPDAYSTINRCIVIRFEEILDTQALTQLQSGKHLFTVFVICFLRWICDQADGNLVEELRIHLLNGDFDFTDPHSSPSDYVGFARVVNSCKLLKICQFLIMKFLSSTNAFSSEKKYDKFNARIGKAISKSVFDTLECVKNNHGASEIVSVILEIFHNDPDDIVTDNPNKFFQGSGKVFLRDNNNYYFRGNTLANYVGGKLNRILSVKALSTELSKFNLIDFYGGEMSSHLPRKFGKKKKRYYRLNVDRLSDFVMSVYPSCLDRMHSPIQELRPKAHRD